MWFGEHPAIGHGQITYAFRLHHPVNLLQMPVLSTKISHMFDDMVGDDHVETRICEGKLYAFDLKVFIPFMSEAVVDHVHRDHIAAQLRMRREVLRDTAGAGADFQHLDRLRTMREIKQTLDLQRLPVARRQVQYRMRLALGYAGIHDGESLASWGLAADTNCSAIPMPNFGQANRPANSMHDSRKVSRWVSVTATASANAA